MNDVAKTIFHRDTLLMRSDGMMLAEALICVRTPKQKSDAHPGKLGCVAALPFRQFDISGPVREARRKDVCRGDIRCTPR
jgi:hypothetical protein